MRPEARRLRPALLRWYDRNRRDLPWRRTRDPYRIWVSEIMLQQTQVATVLPYYTRFLERFPTAASLAAADQEQVLSIWSGLGYYRRARALHAGARMVMERHAGELPADARALREIPGIGRYTAGAVASIAFDLPEPVLDGNVRRVLSRLFAVDGRQLTRAAEQRELWQLAGSLANGKRPGDLNQALMELGATVCVPLDPHCAGCPLRRSCRAHGSGAPERFPAPLPKPELRVVRVVAAWVRRGDRFLVARRHPDGPLRGTWDLPAFELQNGNPATSPAGGLEGIFKQRHGLEVRFDGPAGRVTHGIMNRRLRIEILPGRLARGRIAGRPDLRLIGAEQIPETALSGATLKVLRILQIHGR